MRGPARIGAVLLAAACAGLAAWGCGANFPLPTETKAGKAIPGSGEYQRLATWPAMDGIADLLLIPGPQLFLLFKAAGGEPARVVEYKTTEPVPLSTRFEGSINPGALCAGGNRIFVMDQGDTAAARSNFPCVYTADCGPMGGFSRPITDVSKYWWVREYKFDGSLQSSFTDTSLAWVNGIAADALGQVYLSGVLMFCVVDLFDSRIKSLDFQFRIYRYARGAGGPYVLGPWHRDTGFEVTQGTGVGFTIDPRGMFWANQGGASLYFADYGNNEAQKLDPLSLANSFKLDIGGTGIDSIALVHPLDVSVDKSGYVYVCDTGNRRVLRYDHSGVFVQRVDIKPDLDGNFLVSPVAVSADEDQVYVGDPASAVVAVFNRLK